MPADTVWASFVFPSNMFYYNFSTTGWNLTMQYMLWEMWVEYDVTGKGKL